MSFKLYNPFDQCLTLTDILLFPGGEVGPRIFAGEHGRTPKERMWLPNLLPGADSKSQTLPSNRPWSITARISDSREVMQLLMITDALRRLIPSGAPIRLYLPYVPYGRQDRVMVPGESFSLQVFGDLINSLGFERVTTLDPHSDVTAACIRNLRVITQKELFMKHVEEFTNIGEGLNIERDAVFVSVDAGSNKKTSSLAAAYNHQFFLRADKLRDLATGKIKETVLHVTDEEFERVKNRTVIIPDDLCDGGRSFIELALVLKKRGFKRVILWATTAIMSQGFHPLLDVRGEGVGAPIDQIWTTDSKSWEGDWPRADQVKILGIDGLDRL